MPHTIGMVTDADSATTTGPGISKTSASVCASSTHGASTTAADLRIHQAPIAPLMA